MASSAADLVSFYARSLTGELFGRASTLASYRAILAASDAIPQALGMPVAH